MQRLTPGAESDYTMRTGSEKSHDAPSRGCSLRMPVAVAVQRPRGGPPAKVTVTSSKLTVDGLVVSDSESRLRTGRIVTGRSSRAIQVRLRTVTHQPR